MRPTTGGKSQKQPEMILPAFRRQLLRTGSTFRSIMEIDGLETGPGSQDTVAWYAGRLIVMSLWR